MKTIKASTINWLIWVLGVTATAIFATLYGEYPESEWKFWTGLVGMVIGMNILRFWRVKHDIVIRKVETTSEKE